MEGKKYYSHNPIDLEQYFYRVDSAVSCSVVINNMPNGALIVIIVSGGGSGILNISFGANQKLYNKVEKCLLNQGQLECQLQLDADDNFNEN